MWFVTSLTAFVTSGLMLAMIAEDLWRSRKDPIVADDFIVTIMLVIGFVCSLVVAGHSLAASFH